MGTNQYVTESKLTSEKRVPRKKQSMFFNSCKA